MALEQLEHFPTNPLVFLKYYGWYIVFALLVAALIEKHIVGPWLNKRQTEHSYREATRPERVSLLRTDMATVRQRQQDEAARKSKEAKEAAEAKKLAEMEKKRIANPHEEKRGRKLGTGADNSTSTSTTTSSSRNRTTPTSTTNPWSGGYNPMDPSSGFTSGYRATRRNPRRS